MQPELEASALVFLDETWLSTNMARRYGRCAKGERLRASIPYGHWKTTTFLAGLCHDRLIAPLVLDGPIDGESFLAYVEQFLAPALHPGQIVVAVSHADPIKAAVAQALGTPLDLFQRIMIAPSSITVVAYRRGGPSVLTVNSLSGDLAWLAGGKA